MTCEPLSRQQWMRLLALAPPAELDALLSPLLPDATACRWLRRPETGLAMLQGRAGGTGAR
ncbi:phosphonate C-P lyase system protein PhnG, partial [Laribacter hongkongensis]